MSSPLNNRQQAGPYRISPEQLPWLSRHADLSNSLLVTISPEQSASTVQDWLRPIAAALNFPPHFGGNIDALYDCLCDRDITTTDSLVLVLEHTETLPEESCDTLIAVLQAVADEWRDQGRALWALFPRARLDLDTLALGPLV